MFLLGVLSLGLVCFIHPSVASSPELSNNAEELRSVAKVYFKKKILSFTGKVDYDQEKFGRDQKLFEQYYKEYEKTFPYETDKFSKFLESKKPFLRPVLDFAIRNLKILDKNLKELYTMGIKMVLQSLEDPSSVWNTDFSKKFHKIPPHSKFEYKRLNEIFEFDPFGSQLLEKRHALSIFRKFIGLGSKIVYMQYYQVTVESIMKSFSIPKFLQIHWLLEKEYLKLKTQLKEKLVRNGSIAKADRQLVEFLTHNDLRSIESWRVPVNCLKRIYSKNNARSEMIMLEYVGSILEAFGKVLPARLMKITRSITSMELAVEDIRESRLSDEAFNRVKASYFELLEHYRKQKIEDSSFYALLFSVCSFEEKSHVTEGGFQHKFNPIQGWSKNYF